MLSNVSVDEIFINYFEKMSSALQTPTGVLPLDPAGGTSVLAGAHGK